MRIKFFVENTEQETTALFGEIPLSQTEIDETVNGLEAFTEHQNEKEVLTSDE